MPLQAAEFLIPTVGAAILFLKRLHPAPNRLYGQGSTGQRDNRFG